MIHIKPTKVENSESIRKLIEYGMDCAKKLFRYAAAAFRNNMPLAFIEPQCILPINDVAIYWISAVMKKLKQKCWYMHIP